MSASNITKIKEFVYLYDESGIIGVMYSYNGSTPQPYYYHRNLQGDVIAIYDANGEKQAEYAYDAWGNCEIVYGQNDELAEANPIRYRGYYYDIETKLYYLNARYYSPEWRRFISPDAAEYIDPETPNGLNLYAYCNNDPVNLVDPSGHSIILAILVGALVGATIGFCATVYVDYTDDGEVFNGSVSAEDYVANTLVAGVVGGVSGGLSYTLSGWFSFYNKMAHRSSDLCASLHTLRKNSKNFGWWVMMWTKSQYNKADVG